MTKAHHPEDHAVSPDMHDAPDAWHAHSAAEKPQMAHTEILNAKLISAVGLIGFLLVAGSVVVIYWYYVGYTARLLEVQEQQGLEKPQLQHRAEIASEFRGYSWAMERGATVPGAVQVPLEDATRKVVARYTQPAR